MYKGIKFPKIKSKFTMCSWMEGCPTQKGERFSCAFCEGVFGKNVDVTEITREQAVKNMKRIKKLQKQK